MNRLRWPRHALAAFLVWSLIACSGQTDPAVWKSPGDDAELQALEKRTAVGSTPPERRAQLFFLWGQELAGQGPGKRDQAIAAFEKVVDLGAGLVAQSRFNLEILWRQKLQDSQPQQQQDQQKQDRNKANDKDLKGQNPKPEQQGLQDRKAEPKPHDLSGLVKEKASDPALDQALRGDLQRRIQAQKEVPRGLVTPVEKDW